MKIVLASASRYRVELLGRLRLPFEQMPVDADESGPEGEPPRERAARLSLLKAQMMAQQMPDAVVIASDQVAHADGRILHKPGNYERAHEQLSWMSGREIFFDTGLALVAPHPQHPVQVQVVQYRVKMRPLDAAQITAYVEREQPWDCAASFKSEGLGMALFEWMRGDDPASLIGLPLIALVDMLARVGINPILQGYDLRA